MSDKDDKSTKERILEAAIRLFAQRSYAATGLRDIVREAGVSVAMVNYHFGNKQALLEEIINGLTVKIHTIAKLYFEGPEALELKLRRYIRAMIKVFRKNPDMLRIMITELPLDAPDLVSFKADRVKDIVQLAREKLLPSLPAPARDRIRLEIVAPALIGMLTFHFLVHPVAEKAFDVSFDNEFYEDYADQLADLFLYGIFADSQRSDSVPKDE